MTHPTPQQIADEMTRLLADDDTSDLETIKARAIQNLKKEDKTMKDGICKTCGYWSGLHHWKTHQCPANERESGLFVDSIYTPDESELETKLAAAEKRVQELEAALEKFAAVMYNLPVYTLGNGDTPRGQNLIKDTRRLLDGVK